MATNDEKLKYLQSLDLEIAIYDDDEVSVNIKNYPTITFSKFDVGDSLESILENAVFLDAE